MSDRLQSTLDAIFISIGAITGAVSTLDSIEQIGRILLLIISIISGILLSIINFEKCGLKVRRYLKKRKLNNESKQAHKS